MESLSRSLQALVSESPHSAGSLQLHSSTKGATGRLSCSWKNRTDVLLSGLMSSAVGKALHIGEQDPKTLIDAFDATIANWNLYLFDGFGSYDPDVIYNRIEYLTRRQDLTVESLHSGSLVTSYVRTLTVTNVR